MKPKLREGLYIREIKDEKALYDKETGTVHFLNHTAAFIAELCDGHHTTNDIVTELLKKYDVPHETAVKDVETVLNNLEENEIVEKKS